MKAKAKNKKKEQFKFLKADIISAIAKKGKTTIAETEAFYSVFEEVLKDAITSYSEVVLSPKLGTFKLATHQGGVMHIKGKKYSYGDSTVVRLKISSHLKDLVKDIKLK